MNTPLAAGMEMLPQPRLERLPVRDASSTRAAVLNKLKRAITVNELPAGTRLIQTQLADQLGVSRMPVRDAISDLVAEGLAEPLPGGGAVVTPLSVADMRAVYAVREPLELEAVRLVASMPTVDLTAVESIILRHQPFLSAGDTHQLLDLDRDFHWAIYRSTGNRFLLSAMSPIWSQISRIMFAVLKMPSYSETVWREHEAIAAAIKAGDAELAVALTHQHITNGADLLIGNYE